MTYTHDRKNLLYELMYRRHRRYTTNTCYFQVPTYSVVEFIPKTRRVKQRNRHFINNLDNAIESVIPIWREVLLS